MYKIKARNIAISLLTSVAVATALTWGMGMFLIDQEIDQKVGTTAYIVRSEVVDDGGWFVASHREDQSHSRMLLEMSEERFAQIDDLLNYNSHAVTYSVTDATFTGDTVRVELAFKLNKEWAQTTRDNWMSEGGVFLGSLLVGGVGLIFVFIISLKVAQEISNRPLKTLLE